MLSSDIEYNYNNQSFSPIFPEAFGGSIQLHKERYKERSFKPPAFVLGEYLRATFDKVSSCTSYILSSISYFSSSPEVQSQVNDKLVHEELAEVSVKISKVSNEKIFETKFHHENLIYEELAKVSMNQTMLYNERMFIEYETNFNIKVPLSPDEICLLTAYTSDNDERLKMSKKVAHNQRDYSKKKGYTYLEYKKNLAVETDPITGDTIKWEPYWSKIAAINNILNGKESSSLKNKLRWIVWLDDDAVITNKEIDMEDVISHYTNHLINDDLNFFVTTDSFSSVPLNSAVLFIKNNEWSRMFFNKVWEMRNTKVPYESYTYGNCPQQSCLHEQQAITDLLAEDKVLANHARIIPQRDPEYPIGINTFVRENHFDLNRQGMMLIYDGDNPNSRGKKGDFIQQCTGLSTWALRMDSMGAPDCGMSLKCLFFGVNLRLECIDKLIADNVPEDQSWLDWLSYQSGRLGGIRIMEDLPEAVQSLLNLKDRAQDSTL